MAEMALACIPGDEVLRYLGAAGRDPAPLLPMVRDCCRELLAVARPRWTWRLLKCVPAPEGVLLEGGLLLPGEDLRELLAGCRETVLLAATLSQEVDSLLRRSQLTDLSRSLVLESCATAAIEEVCDQGEKIIAEALPGKNLTRRFSPGYGDLPVTVQREFLALLDAPRKIGLCATGSSILTPRKSVTAVLGVRESGVSEAASSEGCRKGCRNCSLKNSCPYRRKEDPDGL
jgi:hypothetical protein